MEINDLIQSHQETRDQQQRAIFASLFIMENRLQTIFDKTDPKVTLKQFMLLVMLKFSSEEENTLTNMGNLLGCSRQNIKKLAVSLEKYDLIKIHSDSGDKRKLKLYLTVDGLKYFEEIFSLHTQSLNKLFHNYSDSELQLFFKTLMKLYGGIEKLENEYAEKG
ncbi:MULTISPECIES: MarR family winged helix-turn-helix transcriptional regulator [Enterococcus]|uniref:SgrR family transcriptional regulator n=1 Tax=Enterococcus alishanensis TaxID=1303817 RepID=A0ABS6TGN6_9ENTE|nr:SgrR family transcriptional regulator [Enterococcus alishanensis]MBV7392116.1 SgrR family transcriptional regulator [Enterococcus alishanensis]